MLTDGVSVLEITAGYIGFDATGNLLATTGFGFNLGRYDLTSQIKIDDIAAGGIGQFIADGDTIYAVDTDWGSYSSTLEAITVVPEPATLSMVLLGGFAIWRRKNRS